MSESTFFPYPYPILTITEWSRKHLTPSSDEAKFLAFLSLYGTSGVVLRDLIAFATLRVSVKSSENHWLLSGEVGPILRPVGGSSLPTHCSFLNAFVRETSNSQGLDGLQKRLLSLGVIQVEYPMGHPFPAQEYWRTDERIWHVAKNSISSHLMVPAWHDLDGEGIFMDLLYVFLEMPSKDVSLLAERQRETFYAHARVFALESLRFCQTILEGAREYTVALILQILTHRFQTGDNELIHLAKAYSSSANDHDWEIMVLWAELKEVIFSERLRIKTTLNDRITELLSRKGKRQCRANGLIGFLLVEWMKAAEPSHDLKLKIQILKYATDWVESAWYSGSSIEHAALCCVLAYFRMLDRSVLVLPKYHLLYGHHLSRAGHLVQAEEFLTSGLSNCHPLQLRTRLSGYQFELVSVLIRLGRRQQAETWLMDIEDHVRITNVDGAKLVLWEQQHTIATNRDKMFDLWQYLQELAEMKILSGLYQAELLIAAGDVSLVASRLETILNAVYLMDRKRDRREETEDSYFRSLRLALEMRLLEVRIWDGFPERALKAAKALIDELRDKSDLGPYMEQWIVQQLLILCNRLAWAGNVLAALSLLGNIHKVLRYQHCSDSVKDLLPYAEQRRVTFRNSLIIDRARNHPTAGIYESKAAANKPLEGLNGPSNTKSSLKKKTVSDFAGIIAMLQKNPGAATIFNSSNNSQLLWARHLQASKQEQDPVHKKSRTSVDSRRVALERRRTSQS